MNPFLLPGQTLPAEPAAVGGCADEAQAGAGPQLAGGVSWLTTVACWCRE
jgi:hypothetical protein